MKAYSWTAGLVMAGLIVGCGGSPAGGDSAPVSDAAPTLETAVESESPEASGAETTPQTDAGAEVIGVEVTGQPNDYQFSVSVRSPDTGCDRYADWWEVLDENGQLLYRRILLHSHVNEQPFTRSGGPVAIAADQTVIVRAHMNPDGYGRQAQQGTVAAGFEAITLESGFAAAVTEQEPLPSGCTF